ncbi:tetratricopeptide repeat protein 28-like [Montipora foliosa]|uniref:tetratricopeptide repeat protein 28-like n=1 Tax=Montipora foliosa TaxID=591990 RepID=UPI0035F1BE3A
MGYACLNLGNLKEAMEYHEHHLSIAKEIGDCIGEGRAWFLLGHDHQLSGSLSKALSCYRLSIKYFDKTRHNLKSEDEWKISFRDSNRMVYTALWRTLLNNGEIEEALYAAEKGRAQALMDILKQQYGIDSQSFSALAPKQTLSASLELLPSEAVFVALHDNVITFWVLRKDSKISFRQNEIANGSADLLMETILKEIGAGDHVRCENRSLDPLRSDLPCNRKPISENAVLSYSSSVNSLQQLYDVLIKPIAHLIHGDELIVVPDGPLCLAPYSALSESIRIRTIPSLTAFNVIVGSSEDFHSKTGALLVGDLWLKEVINENGEPIFKQLPCAKEEVEMIGERLQTTPLTGKNATKAEVLKRLKSVALVHIAAHGCETTGEIALAPNIERKSPIPKEEDYILKMSDVQAISLRARLVVLSCCHSGRGEVMSEGVVGIARAFLCAGARSVLVSLWAIDDEVTLLFMRSFYQHLADGKSASVALHQAMKSLRESKQYCAVKHWAPFVLVGDDVTLEFPKK